VSRQQATPSAALPKALRKVLHLPKRFWWAVTARPLGEGARAWAMAHLLPHEAVLFDRLSHADQRHHVQVARRFVARVGDGAPRAWVAAALLHDVGKVTCNLGTAARVLAAPFPFLGRGDGNVARYWRHEAIGASLLQCGGSEPDTVSLVGHWPDAPADAAEALEFADAL